MLDNTRVVRAESAAVSNHPKHSIAGCRSVEPAIKLHKDERLEVPLKKVRAKKLSRT